MNTIPQDPKETTVVEFPVAFSGPDFWWNSEELIQLVCDFWKTTQALAEVFIEVPFFRELWARMWSKYKSSHWVTSEFIEEHRQEFQALVFLLWFFSEVRARADRLSVEADQNFLELMRRLFLNTLLRRGGFDDTVRWLKHLQREGGIFRMTYSQSQLLMDVVKGAVGMDACCLLYTSPSPRDPE